MRKVHADDVFNNKKGLILYADKSTFSSSFKPWWKPDSFWYIINSCILSNAFAVKIPLSLHFLWYISFLKAARVDAVSLTAVSAFSSETIISGLESSVIELSRFLEVCAINLHFSVFRFTFIVYLFWFLSVVGVITVATVMGGLLRLFFLGVWSELKNVVSNDVGGSSPLNSFTTLWWYFFLSTSLRVL